MGAFIKFRGTSSRCWRCCSARARPALTDEVKTWTLDDFEDGDLKGAPGVSWIVIADDLVGGASLAQLERPSGGREVRGTRSGSPASWAASRRPLRARGCRSSGPVAIWIFRRSTACGSA